MISRFRFSIMVWCMVPFAAASVFGQLGAVGPGTSLEHFVMVEVPAGSFHNGTGTVSLSAFSIMQTQVTQGLYKAVMGRNIEQQSRLNSFRVTMVFGEGPHHPMYNISWFDGLVFANRLSMREGLTPVYSISGSTDPDRWGSVPARSNSVWDAVTMDRGATGYRLPTEAEWEYAARGATTSRNTIYAGSNTVSEVAWYNSTGDLDSEAGVQPVGMKAANELGLYDMSGNLWEWCWDWLDSYPSDAQTDPTGPAVGQGRVFRGGSWFNPESAARIATRNSGNPHVRESTVGLRFVRAIPR